MNLADYILQVAQCEDVEYMTADELPLQDQQENVGNISTVPGMSRHQILAAQFECYLKIIHDPPRAEEGDFSAQYLLNHLISSKPINHFPYDSNCILFGTNRGQSQMGQGPVPIQ